MTRSVKNVVWPYELHQYTAAWPDNPSNYQIYVRGTSNVFGPDVRIPSGIRATLMSYQEPAGHASPVVNGSFSTSGAGWSLLKYDAANNVSFQVVRSRLHTDPFLFPAGTNQLFSSNIGQEIVEPAHQGPRPGYIHVPEGDRYDWEIYNGNPDDDFQVFYPDRAPDDAVARPLIYGKVRRII